MSKQNYKPSRMKRRRARRRKWRIFVFIPLLLLLIGAGVFIYDLLNETKKVVTNAYENIDRDLSVHRTEIPDPKKDNVSMLIMGIDASEKRGNDDTARTDTLMLATMNVEEKSVKIVSIPRDSYVYIPEVGYHTKINHAHAYGGPKAVIETVEELFEIPVDYFFRLNFEAFMEVVDALDGITVDVPYEFWEQDSKDTPNAIHLMPGVQHLNGEEALALARTRKLDNDIQRGKRQQDIIKAIVSKATSFGSLLKYEEILKAVDGNIATNMEFSEIGSFVTYGLKGTGIDIETFTLEGMDYQPANVYYWKIDEFSLNQTKIMLQQHLGLEAQTYTQRNKEEDFGAEAANQ